MKSDFARTADEDEFEREFGGAAAAPADVDEFDAEFPVAAPAEGEAVPVKPAPPSEPTGMDYLLALADGMSFNHGRMGEDAGNWLADKLIPRPEGTEVAGKGLMDSIPETPGITATRAAGTLLESVPIAIATGGAGLPGMAAGGAATGAASAHGRGEDMVGGAATGAGLALLGGLAGNALKPLAGQAMRMGVPSTGSRAGQIAEMLASKLPSGAATAAMGGGLGVANELSRGNMDPLELLKAGGKGAALGYVAPKLAGAAEPILSVLGKAGPALGRYAGQALAGFAGKAGDEMSPLSSASAQDTPWSVETGDARMRTPSGWDVETGDAQVKPQWNVEIGQAQSREPAPEWRIDIGDAQISGPHASQEWAVQRVLYQGNSGLPPDAERRLTEAAMSGDPDKLATQSFLLSGKYPRFADALQRQRDSLLRKED